MLGVGHDLYGVTEYDDGVYFGAAMHLVAGQLPYRDFTFVQPPGITIILAPIALISGHADPRDGLAAARILTGVIVGLNALLVVWILRHRSLLGAFLGAMLVAIYPPGVYSHHTILLEPYLTFFCLIAVALAFDGDRLASNRRLIFAGIVLGFAGTVKLFAAAVAIAFFFVLVWKNRDKLRPFVIGALIGFLVPCLPFFLGAPSNFIRDVFTSQLGRAAVVPAPFEVRLSGLTGLTDIASRSTLAIGPHSALPWIAGGILALVCSLGTFVPAIRRHGSPLNWFLLLASVIAFGMACLPRQYYTHYVELSAMLFCVLIGGSVGTLARSIRTWSERSGRNGLVRHSRRLVIVASGVICTLIIAAGSAFVINTQTIFEHPKLLRFGDPARNLDRAIPAGACVVSDATSLLVNANRMNFSKSCPVIVDATGTWLTYEPAHPPQRKGLAPKNPALVALWKRAFSHADYAVFAGVSAFRTPFTPALSQWFNDHFERIPNVRPIAFKRREHPIQNAPSITGVIP